MARLPLIADEPEDPRVAEVFARFAREGREPIALYRALAHAPALLGPYSAFTQALRHDATTPRALRELVILRTAQVTGSAYEWSHHRKLAEQAGVAPAKVLALGDWETAGVFDELERAALRFVDESCALAVAAETVERLRELAGEEGVVELVLVAGVYQALARVIQALAIEVEAEYAPYVKGLGSSSTA